MKANRKGFTITELVIVIVVIAILAAVLIPTFASLIKKANISADTQLAKNLNTALTMYEAEGNKVDDFSDALVALTEGGYSLAKLNPTADGHYFAWESESNQILLVDSENNWSVVYKSKDLTNDTIGKTWWFTVSDAPAEVLAELKEKANIANAPKDAEALKNTLDSVFEAGGEQTVYISSGVDLTEDTVLTLDNPNANITLDLTNSALNSEPIFGSAAIVVNKGSLTIKNGEIGATGQITDADGKLTDIPLTAKAGTYTKIEGTTFNINTQNEGYLSFHNTSDLENVTINSTNCGVNLNGAEVVTLKDTTINANYCFFVSNYNGSDHTTESSKLVVDSGNYTSSTATMEVYSGEAVINGGTFTRTSNGPVIFLYNNSFNTKVTIKGGTFVSARDGSYDYEDLTIEIIEKLCTPKNSTTPTVKVTGSVEAGFVIEDIK